MSSSSFFLYGEIVQPLESNDRIINPVSILLIAEQKVLAHSGVRYHLLSNHINTCTIFC